MQFKNSMFTVLSVALLTLVNVSFAESVTALFHQGTNPVAGNPKGKVTVVEFFDYQCSHCVSMTPVVDAIIKNNPDVRVVYKDFPIRGPMSDLAARTAIAAKNQGKYTNVSHAILAKPQPLTEANIMEAAKTSGVNMDRLKKDLNNSATVKQIKSNYDLAVELKIPGTPAFYIGKTDAKDMQDVKFIMGEMNQLEMQKAINEVRKTP